MLIVDSQIHIWGANTPARPWPPQLYEGQSKAHKPQPITKDDMLSAMDAAGVDAVIICPPVWEGVRNDLALAAAKEHPTRFAIMGRVDLTNPASRELLPTWRNQPGMLGLRYSFSKPPTRALFSEGRIDWLWSAAEEAGVPIMVNPVRSELHLIEPIAKRHPKLKLTLDHFAARKGTDEEAFRDYDQVLALAAYPNIAMKVSSAPGYTADSYPYRALHPYVRRIYDAFGPRRMFWGSDYSRLRGTYRECVTMFTEEMPWLSADDLNWIMGRGLCEWLGWKI